MKKILSLLGLSLVAATALAGSEGNLRLCVYETIHPLKPIRYVITQEASSCFYTEGNTGRRTITYPKKEGALLGSFYATKQGVNCGVILGHYEIKSSGGCRSATATSAITVTSDDEKQGSITLNFGDADGVHEIQASTSDPTKFFPISTVQLSAGGGTAGTNTLPCDSGWCTNGKPPGSTSSIIWSPENGMPATLVPPGSKVAKALQQQGSSSQSNQFVKK